MKGKKCFDLEGCIPTLRRWQRYLQRLCDHRRRSWTDQRPPLGMPDPGRWFTGSSTARSWSRSLSSS